MEAIRGLMGGVVPVRTTMTDEQRRVRAEQERLATRLRTMRVDAGIPDRRRQYLPIHPHRRRTDQA